MKKRGIQLLLVIVLVVICVLNVPKYNQVSSSEHDNLIRFHVMANSESPNDQQLKLKVRNRVISFLNTEHIRAENIEEAR